MTFHTFPFIQIACGLESPISRNNMKIENWTRETIHYAYFPWHDESTYKDG